jgi:hypothetical protein
MIRYTVVWSQQALDQVVTLWIEQPRDRQDLAQAVAETDTARSRDPFQAGRPLHEGIFVVALAVMRCLYTIREDERTVDVVFVAGYPRT